MKKVVAVIAYKELKSHNYVHILSLVDDNHSWSNADSTGTLTLEDPMDAFQPEVWGYVTESGITDGVYLEPARAMNIPMFPNYNPEDPKTWGG